MYHLDACQHEVVSASGPDSRSRAWPDPVRWSVAMDRALYGPDGFYVAGPGAAGHFRTSASASVGEIFADALAELLSRVDAALGHPDALDLVDVGGASGGLVTAIVDSVGPRLRARVRPCVVERRARPAGLAANVCWLEQIPDMTGLLIANEWLDNIAIDVVAGDDVLAAEVSATVLLVDGDGTESPGSAPTSEETAWLSRWWPSGDRREIGLHRDRAWAGAVAHVRRGLAVAIDYAHVADERPAYGTLTGFRLGRETEPDPDGSCDITAHVAIDSVAVAGEEAASAVRHGAAPPVRSVRTLLTDQRTALRLLGVSGRRPDYDADPGGYAAALQRASDCADLIDPAGLGAFAWLLQGIDLDLDPTALLA